MTSPYLDMVIPPSLRSMSSLYLEWFLVEEGTRSRQYLKTPSNLITWRSAISTLREEEEVMSIGYMKKQGSSIV